MAICRYTTRNCTGKAGWVCSGDGWTIGLSKIIIAQFGAHFGGRCPWVVTNHLHRSKLDVNRDADVATGGDANAATAWNNFHDFVTVAQTKVNKIHGNDGAAVKVRDGEPCPQHGSWSLDLTKAKHACFCQGLLIDLHGYSGTDYDPSGSPYVLYSYRLNATTLNRTVLDSTLGGSVNYAAQRLGPHGMERVVRGDVSFGALVPGIDVDHAVGSIPATCGQGLPSPRQPNPAKLCSKCRYFSGLTGSNLKLHDTLQVRNSCGLSIACPCSKNIRFRASVGWCRGSDWHEHSPSGAAKMHPSCQ